GRFLAIAGNATLGVWEISNGQKLASFRGHESWVNDVAFSPDGQAVISGSADRTLKVWDLKPYPVVQTLLGHSNWLLGRRQCANRPDNEQHPKRRLVQIRQWPGRLS